jgi:hypothetical protein
MAESTMFSIINAPSMRKLRNACSTVSLPSESAASSASDGLILDINHCLGLMLPVKSHLLGTGVNFQDRLAAFDQVYSLLAIGGYPFGRGQPEWTLLRTIANYKLRRIQFCLE